MKIVVFGATGKTGRLVVEKALADGHEVTAFARDPAKLATTHPALRTLQGAADQPDKIAEAVEGTDAVISAMGSGRGTLTTFARHLVPAMHQAGVRRVVSLIGAGVATPGDPRSLGRSVMLGLMRAGRAARPQGRDGPCRAVAAQRPGLDPRAASEAGVWRGHRQDPARAVLEAGPLARDHPRRSRRLHGRSRLWSGLRATGADGGERSDVRLLTNAPRPQWPRAPGCGPAAHRPGTARPAVRAARPFGPATRPG